MIVIFVFAIKKTKEDLSKMASNLKLKMEL